MHLSLRINKPILTRLFLSASSVFIFHKFRSKRHETYLRISSKLYVAGYMLDPISNSAHVCLGCSEDEAAGVVNAEVGGGCATGAPTTGSGVGGGSGTGSEVGGGGGGGGGAGAGTEGGGGGGGGGEGGSTKQGGERCPQCGFLCRDVHVLQLHLEDTHKTSYAIDKNDLNAQFPQVVSETNVKDEEDSIVPCVLSITRHRPADSPLPSSPSPLSLSFSFSHRLSFFFFFV